MFALGLAAATVSAQEFGAGDIRIGNPFATPTPPGARVGAAYFEALENRGTQADRLLKASSTAAARVELHYGDVSADGVMRMRELDSLSLPPGSILAMRPGQGNHLMLMDLKKPLAAGDAFALTLEFERAGTLEVRVVVRAPAPGGEHAGGRKH